MTVEDRMKELGIVLPNVTGAVANYLPCVREGNLVFVSGHGPLDDGVPEYVGRIGDELTEAEGYEAARLCALGVLATLKKQFGSLEKIDRIIKVLGFVSSVPGFSRQPAVLNGASDLFVSLFGEKGKHARSAIGACELPFNIPVEIEVIVTIKD